MTPSRSTELLVHAVGYGAMPAKTIGDVGVLTQALLMADASSGHTRQAEAIRGVDGSTGDASGLKVRRKSWIKKMVVLLRAVTVGC